MLINNTIASFAIDVFVYQNICCTHLSQTSAVPVYGGFYVYKSTVV